MSACAHKHNNEVFNFIGVRRIWHWT